MFRCIRVIINTFPINPINQSILILIKGSINLSRWAERAGSSQKSWQNQVHDDRAS